MNDCCDDDQDVLENPPDNNYRRILWVVLAINAGMFVVEIVAGWVAGSVALQANALDFFGDAANYVIALYVLRKSLRWRAYGSIIKAATFGLLALWVLGQTIYRAIILGLPSAEVMGWISVLALIANLICAFMLYRHREGDSNRRSVWICSRNDSIGNIAVLLSAGAVYFTESKWPDLIVAAVMAFLSFHGAWQIIRHANTELKTGN